MQQQQNKENKELEPRIIEKHYYTETIIYQEPEPEPEPLSATEEAGEPAEEEGEPGLVEEEIIIEEEPGPAE